jgi:hypothetical protein
LGAHLARDRKPAQTIVADESDDYRTALHLFLTSRDEMRCYGAITIAVTAPRR